MCMYICIYICRCVHIYIYVDVGMDVSEVYICMSGFDVGFEVACLAFPQPLMCDQATSPCDNCT